MKRLAFLFLYFTPLLFSIRGIAQSDSSCGLRISILTCAPGEDLYSIFGHSALRIIDSVKGTDIVYNWGTFDFDEPGFYTKFMRGKLRFFVSPDKVQDFEAEYEYEERNVTEQILDISSDEKLRLKKAVDINMTGDNRFYKYDWLTDNCTTRLRDLVESNINTRKITGRIVPPGTTVRNMIHSYLDKGNQPWSKLGIDILLGSTIDTAVSEEQAMFLPDYLMKATDSFSTAGHPLVKNKSLLVAVASTPEIESTYEPLIAITVVCLLLFFPMLMKGVWVKKFVQFADTLLLYITGLTGILILFMWFFTDHNACRNNYNIAWALPTNFIIAFFAWKKPLWIHRYFKVAAGVTLLLLINWFWMPQQMNSALLPFTLLMFYRYIKLANPS